MATATEKGHLGCVIGRHHPRAPSRRASAFDLATQHAGLLDHRHIGLGDCRQVVHFCLLE